MSVPYPALHRHAGGFWRRVRPLVSARSFTSTAQPTPLSHTQTTTPPRPSPSARLHLRSRSSTFIPIDPSAVTIPASLVERINNSLNNDLDNDDDDDDDPSTADDDIDPATLIDRSTAARRTLFRTLRQLQRMDAASLSMEYVDAIITSLTSHSPLLPREQVHIAVLYAHVGRETEAVVWIGRLLREGQMTAEWAEMVRQSAERAALVGLEERMNRIVKTLKTGNDSTAPATSSIAEEAVATAKA